MSSEARRLAETYEAGMKHRVPEGSPLVKNEPFEMDIEHLVLEVRESLRTAGELTLPFSSYKCYKFPTYEQFRTSQLVLPTQMGNALAWREFMGYGFLGYVICINDSGKGKNGTIPVYNHDQLTIAIKSTLGEIWKSEVG